MKLKSFFANTIEEAIRLARSELGPEAMLVNSKRTDAEAQHLGFYEVVVCGNALDPVAGVPSSFKAQPAGAQPRTQQTPAASFRERLSPSTDQLSRDLSDLKRRMEQLALTLGRCGQGMPSVAFSPELSRVFAHLTDAELDTELAYDIVAALPSPLDAGALRSALNSFVQVDSEVGSRGVASRVVALVGPPGAGKTSVLVKLAVHHGLSARKRVHILAADTYRISAAEELRSYAAILGIGCQVVNTAEGLVPALEENRQKDLILVDTPGLCRTEMDLGDDLARVLATQPGIDTHLVLPASMRAADLTRVAEQYSVFNPRKLLFTRLDETRTFGPILSRSVRMEKPVSFFSWGQRIAEDLEPATPDLMLDLVLGCFTPGLPRFDTAVA